MMKQKIIQKYFGSLLCFSFLNVAQAQITCPVNRTVEMLNTGDIQVSYAMLTDSISGFFMLTDSFSCPLKNTLKKSDYPLSIQKNRIQITGDQLSLNKRVELVFANPKVKFSVKGHISLENYPNEAKKFVIQEHVQEYDEALAQNHQQSAPQKPTGEEKKAESVRTYMSEKPVTPAAAPAVEKNAVVENTPVVNNSPAVEKTLAQTVENPVQPTVPAAVPANVSATNSNNDTEVYFRVQLAASGVPMDKQKLANQLSLPEYEIQEERIDGLYKYTIGQEKTLSQANTILAKISPTRFKKPFVVAYQGKKRISIQQAMGK